VILRATSSGGESQMNEQDGSNSNAGVHTIISSGKHYIFFDMNPENPLRDHDRCLTINLCASVRCSIYVRVCTRMYAHERWRRRSLLFLKHRIHPTDAGFPCHVPFLIIVHPSGRYISTHLLRQLVRTYFAKTNKQISKRNNYLFWENGTIARVFGPTISYSSDV